MSLNRMVQGTRILNIEAWSVKITNLPLERQRSPFSLKFICVKRLSNFMTRPPSNLKFKQKSSLITVILFGHVIHTGTKYSRKNLENTIVLTTKLKKLHLKSKFLFQDFISDFVSKFQTSRRFSIV